MMISAVINETISNHSNRRLLAGFSWQVCFVDITEVVGLLGDPQKSKGTKG